MATNKLIDLLVIEDDKDIINLVKAMCLKQSLQVLFASDTTEFIALIKKYEFKNVLCDIHLSYRYEGLLIARMYASIKKINIGNGKIYKFSSEPMSKKELLKNGFDDSIGKNHTEIQTFLYNCYGFNNKFNINIENVELEKVSIAL